MMHYLFMVSQSLVVKWPVLGIHRSILQVNWEFSQNLLCHIFETLKKMWVGGHDALLIYGAQKVYSLHAIESRVLRCVIN